MTYENGAAGTLTPDGAAATNTWGEGTSASAAQRRMRLHHVFRRRRRWSRELDEMLVGDPRRGA